MPRRALAAVLAILAITGLVSAQDQAEEILRSAEVHGGLVVHLGCGDGTLTGAFGATTGYIVHGLDSDVENVRQAREHIRDLGLYGKVSVERWLGDHLPYTGNLVNLLVADDLGPVSWDEVMRVLVPGGVAYVKKDEKWTKTIKPRPKEIDDWTHFLYDASNNAVSRDASVAPPAHVQWIGRPKWARSHEHLASISAVVAAGGRIFYILDEGPIESIEFPPKWVLVARDGFNGVILWKRPIGPWQDHLRRFRSGPPQLPRRLVAVGDRVYVSLGYGKPVAALDAATGKTILRYEGTEGAEEIVCVDGSLLVAVNNTPVLPADATQANRRGKPPATRRKTVLAIEAGTGRIRWQKVVNQLAPVTLGAADGRVFFQDGQQLVAIDLKTGKPLWQTESLAIRAPRHGFYSPVVVAFDDVLLWADGRMLTGLSAQTGKTLWKTKSVMNWHAPPDVLVAGELLWTGDTRMHQGPGVTAGRDPKTGEVKMTRARDQKTFTVGMTHHRCYRNKATDRYLLLGRAGVEYLDVSTGRIEPHHWVRGMCQYGVMPANGLLYAPPHACACYLTAKLDSFNALAPARDERREASDQGKTRRLEQGPAYDIANCSAPQPTSDWPTYRHDRLRSGATTTTLPTELEHAWRADLGGRLSAVTVADGKCFVASVDTHTVHAIDAATGEPVWSFTTGGRVDTPPTIAAGLAVFGSADGYVYCVCVADGRLAWRYRAAPEERRVMVYGQLESVWPVHGSVLVEGDSVVFAAGRSSFLDDGIRLVRLRLKSGHKLAESCIDSREPKTGLQPLVKGFNMSGALPDVLASDGTTVFMRQLCFNSADLTPTTAKTHLYSPTGLTDDSSWHRTYWLYGQEFISGWHDWWKVGNQVPAGRLLALDDTTVYGFGRSEIRNHLSFGGGNWAKAEPYHLFAVSKQSKKAQPPGATQDKKKVEDLRNYFWSTDSPVRVRTLALAAGALWIAGPPNLGNHGPDALAAYRGRKGAALYALSATDGKTLAKYKLASAPVYDGMAVAGGRLFIPLENGTISCLAEAP